MTIQRKRLFLNFSSLSIVQLSNVLLSIFIVPYVVRKIGPGEFGVIAVAQVVVIYLAVLTDYASDQTATREIAVFRNDNDPLPLSKIFFSVLFSKLIVCLVCFGLFITLVILVPLFYAHMNLYMLAFVFVIGQAMLINWFFLGTEKMQFITIPALVGRIVFVLLSFLFIKQKTDSSLFLLFMGLGNIVAAAFGMMIAFRIYRLQFVWPGWMDVKHRLKNGWHITLSNLSMTTCQYIGVVILRIFSNDILVGYYSIAEKIYQSIKLMLSVFSQTVYPQTCKIIQKGLHQTISFFKQAYIPFFLLVLAGCIVVFFFSSEILYVFIGHHYQDAAFYLRMLCVALIIVCLNIPAALILLASDHKKSYLKVFALGTIVHLAGNFLLAHYYQATGTVIATIITEMFITITLYWEVYKIFFSKKQKLIST